MYSLSLYVASGVISDCGMLGLCVVMLEQTSFGSIGGSIVESDVEFCLESCGSQCCVGFSGF